MDEYPVPGDAVLVSAATRVLSVETLRAVRIPDPTSPGVAIEDGPGWRVELDIPDRGGTVTLEYGWGATRPSRQVLHRARNDLVLLRGWRDLDVELEVYELGWHEVWLYRDAHYVTDTGRRTPIRTRWVASRLVSRLVDPLHRHLDLPAPRSLNHLLGDWREPDA